MYIIFVAEKIEDVIFYKLEKAVRRYRQFAQAEIRRSGLTITIDQWLIMKTIVENPGIKQHDLAERVFKDSASITRIIELLVRDGYLDRSENRSDRRRSTLSVTPAGERTVVGVMKIVERNRETVLAGIAEVDLVSAGLVTEKIVANCDHTRGEQ